MGVTLVLLGLAWMLLAPAALGGGWRSLAIHGSSMEPTLSQGDLSVIRPMSTYEVGDIVAYRSSMIGETLLHRIVDVEGDRFVIQGDANPDLDPEMPTVGEILGRQVLHLPGMARAFRFLPMLLAAGMTAWFLMSSRTGSASDARRSNKPIGKGSIFDPRAVLIVGGAVMLIGAMLLMLPAARSRSSIDASHVGAFSYRAKAPRSIYPDGDARTGEAVFVEAMPRVKVAFSYRLDTDAVLTSKGTIALHAVIEDGAGWSRRLPISDRVPFQGSEARATGVLDLAGIERILERLADSAGVVRGTVRVVLNADVRTEIHGAADQRFSPRLDLEFDRTVLRLPQGASDAPSTRSLRAISIDGPVVSHPRRIGPSGLDVPAASLGWFLLAAGASAAALARIWSVDARSAGPVSLDRLPRRFAHREVDLATMPSLDHVPVATLEGFERLADDCASPVLRAQGAAGTTWLLKHEGITYSFRERAAEPAREEASV